MEPSALPGPKTPHLPMFPTSSPLGLVGALESGTLGADRRVSGAQNWPSSPARDSKWVLKGCLRAAWGLAMAAKALDMTAQACPSATRAEMSVRTLSCAETWSKVLFE